MVPICIPCPAGYNCPSRAELSGPCNAGTYSLKGEAECNNCSPGYMCPTTENMQIRCSLGQTTNGSINSLHCSNCPAGYSCSIPE